MYRPRCPRRNSSTTGRMLSVSASGNKGHTYWKCSNVSPKMKEMIIEREKNKLADKNAAGVANLNTQSKEDLEDDDAFEGVAIILESDGMPTREDMLKTMGFVGVGVCLIVMSDQYHDSDDNAIKFGFASPGATQHPIEMFYNKKEVTFDHTSKPGEFCHL